MPIPDYQTVMLPLLEFYGDGKEHSIGDDAEAMSKAFRLTESEKRELLPSGQSTTIRSRAGWARTYLGKAGLLERSRRGFWRITTRGREVLAEKPGRIDHRFLQRFPEYQEFMAISNSQRAKPNVQEDHASLATATPQEALEYAYLQLQHDLVGELRERLLACPPAFFEKLVVELLVKMGYGGSFRDAAEVVGRSGDGGIDGIIKEDKLGLDMIYVQAKRWDGGVGRPEIQKFVGALAGHGAQKGVFITTSSFTADALEYARNRVNNIKIVLIDGSQLAELMMDHNLGVATARVFEVKRLDSDYFTEE